jgi:hypothetical protein
MSANTKNDRLSIALKKNLKKKKNVGITLKNLGGRKKEKIVLEIPHYYLGM